MTTSSCVVARPFAHPCTFAAASPQHPLYLRTTLANTHPSTTPGRHSRCRSVLPLPSHNVLQHASGHCSVLLLPSHNVLKHASAHSRCRSVLRLRSPNDLAHALTPCRWTTILPLPMRIHPLPSRRPIAKPPIRCLRTTAPSMSLAKLAPSKTTAPRNRTRQMTTTSKMSEPTATSCSRQACDANCTPQTSSRGSSVPGESDVVLAVMLTSTVSRRTVPAGNANDAMCRASLIASGRFEHVS